MEHRTGPPDLESEPQSTCSPGSRLGLVHSFQALPQVSLCPVDRAKGDRQGNKE